MLRTMCYLLREHAFQSILSVMEGTKEIFAEAFRRLKVQNPDGKITVKRIAEEAGFDRHTFYYHFSSVDDLISWIIDSKLLTIFANDDVSWEDIIHSAVSLFMDDSWSELATKINESTYALMISKITPFIEKDMAWHGTAMEEKDIRLISQSAVWAVSGAFHSWMENPDWRDETDMAEKLIRLIRRYIESGVDIFSCKA